MSKEESQAALRATILNLAFAVQTFATLPPVIMHSSSGLESGSYWEKKYSFTSH